MPRYTFGPFSLDPEARVLLRDGEPTPMAGRTLDILVVLVQNRGRLVDKDELLSRVWAGTVVEEANLSQSIFTVRKILGDSPKEHRYIATVAGRGYQFVAPVTESTTRTEPGVGDLKEPPRERSTFWRRNRILQFGAVGIGVAVLTVGIEFWGVWHSVPQHVPQPIPFTSGMGVARYPAFSPDGKQIAYNWVSEDHSSASLYVKMVGGDTELRITDSPGQDVHPAWSPDGRQIAFYRELKGHSGYYVVSALGGPPRQLLQVDSLGSVAWFPDGKHVALALPVEQSKNPDLSLGSGTWAQHRIVSLDIETGEQIPLTAPPKNPFGDEYPLISPDGRTLAFVRPMGADADDIYLLALDRREQPRRLTNFGGSFGGAAWTPDSRELIFVMFQNGDSRVWRLPINGGGARAITSSLETVFSPIVARQGNRLAYVVATGHTSLWRVDISASHPLRAGLPKRIINSARDQSQPMYSPDGNRIAFTCNRAGPQEIWVADAEGRDAVQLTNCGGPNNGSPRWSPDGSKIAFDSRIHGNPEILAVTVEGHKIQQITHDPAEDVVASWSADGRWIYFGSTRNGEFQIYKVSSVTGESPSSPRVQVTTGGGLNAVESPDGRYLYFAKGRGKRGLWRRRLGQAGEGREEPVLDSLEFWGWWALAPDGIFFLEHGHESPRAKVHLKFLELASRAVTELISLDHHLNSEDRPITVSPDGRHIVYEQGENGGSNIVLLENFR